jgi:hypothetical protein
MRIPDLRVTACRPSLAVLAMALVCIGCTAPTAQESQAPSDTPAVTASASASATATPTPSATSEPSATLAPSPTSSPTADHYSAGDVLAVTGDGLAVREGPGTAYTMLGAARSDNSGTEVLGSPYRLAAGEQLVVGQGPLTIDGRDWYGVAHSDDAIHWTPPDEPEAGIQGWIAANDGAAHFVRLVAEGSDPCCFMESGVGSATTAAIPTLPVGAPGAIRGFTLMIGHTDPAGSCHVRVTDDTDQVLLDQTVVGWGNPGAWWPGDGDQLVIDTECSWSLRVGNFVA